MLVGLCLCLYLFHFFFLSFKINQKRKKNLINKSYLSLSLGSCVWYLSFSSFFLDPWISLLSLPWFLCFVCISLLLNSFQIHDLLSFSWWACVFVFSFFFFLCSSSLSLSLPLSSKTRKRREWLRVWTKSKRGFWKDRRKES